MFTMWSTKFCEVTDSVTRPCKQSATWALVDKIDKVRCDLRPKWQENVFQSIEMEAFYSEKHLSG